MVDKTTIENQGDNFITVPSDVTVERVEDGIEIAQPADDDHITLTEEQARAVVDAARGALDDEGEHVGTVDGFKYDADGYAGMLPIDVTVDSGDDFIMVEGENMVAGFADALEARLL